ncbi:MAG TPA: D-alanyl-D-alanine carboxypeptidase, partial [Ruminococcus sp.]|nr:D-alanyl-D-alanine carboxypeptidase [Ruminococcus sp.]
MELRKKLTIMFICLTVLYGAIPRRVCAETVMVEDLLAAMPADEIIAV